ncbi:MAG TPA: LytR C-terminal domain-containing protein [Patescibacteria group bacterium]|nr:LytR C-terminal domain-containing protein [Patescibacteria group bacterium]
MDKEFSNFASYSTNNKSSSSAKKRAIVYVIVFTLIIGATIVVGNYFLSTHKSSPHMLATVTPTPTPTAMPSLTPTPSVTPSATLTPAGHVTKTSPTPTPKVTVSPTPASSKNLEIEVLNGSGIKGEAGKVASLLKNDGYSISSTGNADSFAYQKTVIQIKKSKQSFATQLEKDLASAYTVDSSIKTLAESSAVDAIVIVGSQ